MAMSAPVRSNLVWHKSSRSNGDGNVCVEVAFLPLGAGAAVRDSKDPAGGALVLPSAAWDRFRRAARAY
jgi:hypothetical protein